MIITSTPIGTIRSERSEIVDDGWGPIVSTIVLDPDVFEPAAVLGLDEFSHVEVIFTFHLCQESDTQRGARHPRDNTSLPRVGVLAQRVKDRPNHLGVSRCELLSVDGMELVVRGLDAIDGTPVLDVKPFLSAMVPAPDSVKEPDWVSSVMKNYEVIG